MREVCRHTTQRKRAPHERGLPAHTIQHKQAPHERGLLAYNLLLVGVYCHEHCPYFAFICAQCMHVPAKERPWPLPEGKTQQSALTLTVVPTYHCYKLKATKQMQSPRVIQF
eukprot:1162064-Pelagomonas_calceolata.AAC.2